MGKGKKKKDGKRAKAPKLPKQIAGIKVPKELRGPGGRILAAVQDPMVIEIAAAALAAAAGRLRDTARAAPAPEPAKPKGGETMVGDIAKALATSAIQGLSELGETGKARPSGGAKPDREA